MKKNPILKHLGIAILIWVIALVIITPFPENMPHPEDFSPTAWLFAIGMTFYLLSTTGDRRAFWRFLPIPIIAILGFLEEIAWGVELNLIQPIYLEQFDLTVYDAHNFVPAITRIFLKNIGAEQWHSELFDEFLRIDMLAFLVGLTFIVALRIGTKKLNANEWRAHILQIGSWMLVLPSTFALWQLLSLPVDPKNAFLFGFSVERLLPIVGFIVLALASAVFAVQMTNPSARTSAAEVIEGSVITEDRPRKIGIFLSAIFVAVILFQFIAPLDPPPDRVVLFERIIPLVGWLFAVTCFLLLAISAWKGGLRKRVIDYFLPIPRFFIKNPPYIYTFFAIGLILFAQGIDKAYIPLNKYIVTPNFWVPNWELWIEELSEMVAAVELVAAAFYFPYPPYPSLQKEIARRRK
ncbi:MAG: hypothetical protein WEC37_02505 [Anaerolineales bacterium]